MEFIANAIELFNDDKSCKIRCYKDGNNTYMFSVFDFINLINKRGIYDVYGKDTFYRSFSKQEQTKLFVKQEFKMLNNRFYQTPCSNILGLIDVLYRIPGKMDEKFTEFSIRTIMLVLTDDKQILKIIEKNNENNRFIQQIRRYIAETQENGVDISLLNDKIKSLNLELEVRKNQADILLRENFKLFQKVNNEKENSEIYYDKWFESIVKSINISDNYAFIPKPTQLIEYFVIIKKSVFDYEYDSRAIREDESKKDYILDTYKYYCLRGQKQYIKYKIDKIVNKLDLKDHKILIKLKTANPITLFLKLQELPEIIADTKNNHMKVIDELKLIKFCQDFQKNI
jgi:hypothetical protein